MEDPAGDSRQEEARDGCAPGRVGARHLVADRRLWRRPFPQVLFCVLLLTLSSWPTVHAADRPDGMPPDKRLPFGIPGVADDLLVALPRPAPSPGGPLPEPRALPSPQPASSLITESPLGAAGDGPPRSRWRDDLPTDDESAVSSLRLGGLVQLDSTAYSAGAGPMQPIDQAGLAPALFDAVNFRRARLRLDGTLGEQYDWAAEYDFVNQINAYNQIDPLHPSLGPLPEVTDLWLQMRDVPFVGPFNDGFVPGIQATNGTDDGLLGWQIGEFVNTAAPFGFSDFAGGSLTTGRVVWLPAYADGGRQLLHLGLAGRTMQPHNGLVRFRSRGALWNGPPGPDNAIYADSGVLAGSWQNMLGTELVANRGPWSLQAEYFGSWLYDASTTDIGPLSTAGYQPPPGTPVGTVFYQGGYAEMGWFLTGESRTYSLAEHRFDRPLPRRMLMLSRSRPWGKGAWQAVARYNYLCLSDGQVDGGVLNGATLGLNWLLTPYARVVFNYDYTYRDYRSTPWASAPSGPVPAPSYDGSGGIHGFGTRLAFDF